MFRGLESLGYSRVPGFGSRSRVRGSGFWLQGIGVVGFGVADPRV